MAHERIEVDLPLAKVYEYLSDPTYFPHYFERINRVKKINSQTFEFSTLMGGEKFEWTTNIIDNLRNTRFAWITINGNLNQTGTVRFTPLDNGERTRVDFSLDYRTFYGEPDEELAKFIQGLPAQMKKDLQRFKEEVESDTFKEKAEATLEEMEAAVEAEEEEAEEAAA
ncbi:MULTISPECIES: SRPBCC family protein [Fodinibius]|uniref:Polyketide cyclase / dehydrase and lipid transport n=1 Tax=Fodinibius roseus TaxID=1194090 RepID=A0A1M4SWN9_9BACT|nr:SRPBCC family protein [Fodinibius roseus]SHE36622.1 Polyketide cyclase / dehydrase and lipid transport [Fodinibius roseus]